MRSALSRTLRIESRAVSRIAFVVSRMVLEPVLDGELEEEELEEDEVEGEV
jgi:hypothetical protein